MAKHKYNIDDIKKGDEVIFYSTNLQGNHDEYWTVIGKRGNDIMIELKKSGFDKNWTITIEEVVGHIPLSKS
ncbi:hypothetical protein [Sediminibacterium salmoneum]|uniref:hypothetical protein n=1 Tax=Sediminibacterium salmoneum TaxID=426421 RepID=UPI00047EBC1A|nr:hypothetical protein [Sediminibacterium salmoneum]